MASTKTKTTQQTAFPTASHLPLFAIIRLPVVVQQQLLTTKKHYGNLVHNKTAQGKTVFLPDLI